MATAGSGNQQIPWQQRLMDQPFLLLGLGIIVMFVFYTIWGVIELMNMPTGQLP